MDRFACDWHRLSTTDPTPLPPLLYRRSNRLAICFSCKNNICVVFFRMSRRFRSKRKFILCFYGIILNLPVPHRMLTNAVCFVLSFILKGCLFFRFCFIPHMPDFAKLHPQACKTRKLFGSGLPEVLSLSAKHSDYKSAKIGCQALRRIKFRQFYENTLKNLRIRGKLWNTDKTNAVFKPVARFSAGRIRPMQCRCAVCCLKAFICAAALIRLLGS